MINPKTYDAVTPFMATRDFFLSLDLMLNRMLFRQREKGSNFRSDELLSKLSRPNQVKCACFSVSLLMVFVSLQRPTAVKRGRVRRKATKAGIR